MRTALIATVGLMVMSLTGCISETKLLTDDQGRTQTCESKGHIGVISPIRVYMQQRSCIDKAKAAGYHETPSPS
jgi:hypothetical protein